MKTRLYSAIALAAILSLAACVPKVEITSLNPSALVADEAKYEMLHSLQSVDSDLFFVMDYTQDYHLDELLEADASSLPQMLEFFSDKLLDVKPPVPFTLGMGAGCSAFAATDPSTGDFLMGRNYDYCHKVNGVEVPLEAILVKTAPKGGKKSISMVDSYWIGYPKGFYTDGKTDLSALMAAPFAILDGINQDGLAVGILHLSGKPAVQRDSTKKSIWCNVVMRAMLDKTATVEEALEMVRNYNVSMMGPSSGSYHIFLADATGDFAILEYSYADGQTSGDAVPDRMVALKGDPYRYVTNFYVDPQMASDEKIGGLSNYGKSRYLTLQDSLTVNAYKLTKEQASALLEAVSIPEKPEKNASHTQWSALYNLSRKTLDLSILRDYGTTYSFSVR